MTHILTVKRRNTSKSPSMNCQQIEGCEFFKGLQINHNIYTKKVDEI